MLTNGLRALADDVRAYEADKRSDGIIVDYQLALLATEVVDTIGVQAWPGAHAQASDIARAARRRTFRRRAVYHVPGHQEQHAAAGYGGHTGPRETDARQKRDYSHATASLTLITKVSEIQLR